MVEYGNEGGILLPVHLLQFDGHEAHFPEHLGREEIGRGIVAVQHLPFVGLDHRFELEYVPHEQQLLAAERFPGVMSVESQYAVDEVDDVRTHHRDFVDDDEFHLADELLVGGVVFQEVLEPACAEARVVGQERIEGEFEETMERAATGIDGGNAGGGQHDMFLARVGAYIF